ncbi:MAG: winged helix-turn-helix transcriptional regulator [Chloroflexi bacterium]|jgi:DNA-binding transcriptional ArsR family regulator|nr:winged helix-turn-helix transcriptional regulator [Chloroflexota bacterium]MBT3390873.1 winged helix-turn-helix transcriptional regulator [Chloroflexota bacterium]
MNSSSDLAQEINQLHAEICSALADPRRILMLYKLADRPWNVGDLAISIGISQSATSRHLKILRQRSLVSATRKGASVEYQLIDSRLIEALDLLRAVLYGRLTHRANLIEEATNAA